MNTFSGPPKEPSQKMGNRDMAKSQQYIDDVTSGRRNEHKRADTELPNLKKAINLNLDHSVNEHDETSGLNMADSARQPQVLANNLKELFNQPGGKKGVLSPKRKKIFDHRMSEQPILDSRRADFDMSGMDSEKKVV